MADWSVWSRDTALALGDELPFSSLTLLLKHLDVSTGIVMFPFTPQRWNDTGPGCGVVARRDGVDLLTGPVVEQQLLWDAGSERALIKLMVEGDETRLADRIVWPDPTRQPDAQSTVDYWTATETPSAGMLRLVREQAGSSAQADYRIPRLYLGPDPGIGAAQPWSFRYDGLLDALATMSVRSGANIAPRLTSTVDGLRLDVIAPRNLAASVDFTVELGNLTGVTFRRGRPDVTDAVTAGGGDLKLRLQRVVTTTDAEDLAWLLRRWRYIDRRDTTDTAELLKSAADGVAGGQGMQSVAFALADTGDVRYGVDWGPYPGDTVTVYVAVPGFGDPVGTVVDVVRQIRLDVDEDGAEAITPAVGGPDATVKPTPASRAVAARVGTRLSLLERRK
ncbi:Gp37-like protein [Klenkia brasiliensis]|uniref:Virus ReqiPepy6 Gp37-like protein n=1 Tax=Klenkia brasiliensis TaxID=333142 RepID=A0A1G7YEY0_9ACTN|nr:hypothetical protein [Klenkia brasiliensis]SDG94993.1 virus ReqiPepy6 Gp37-like protein [Klenkia brasiliensis]